MLVALAPAVVAAQERGTQPVSNRPFQGLFGGNQGAVGRARALDLSVSVYGAYDDNVLAGEQGTGGQVGDPRLQSSGYFAGLQAGLLYAREMEQSALQALVASSFRYYPDRDDRYTPSLMATLDYGTALGRRNSLSLQQIFRYLPYYRLGLLPGPVSGLPVGGDDPVFEDVGGDVLAPADDDLALTDRESIQWAGAVHASRRLSQRGTLSAFYTFALTSFTDPSDPDAATGANDDGQQQQRVGTSYSYRLTRDLTLRARYSYQRRWHETEGVEPIGVHNVDGGADYSRTFQIGSQRTQIIFSTGSTILTRERFGSEGQSTGRDYIFRLLGNATIFHQITRTWAARATYQRNFRFLDGFDEPAAIDAVTGWLGGYIGPRVDVALSASYSFGSIGATTRNYDTGLVSGRIQYALLKSLAAFGQYFFYRYDFNEDVTLPAGLPRSQDRQGVRVGLNWWLPLLQ